MFKGAGTEEVPLGVISELVPMRTVAVWEVVDSAEEDVIEVLVLAARVTEPFVGVSVVELRVMIVE